MIYVKVLNSWQLRMLNQIWLLNISDNIKTWIGNNLQSGIHIGKYIPVTVVHKSNFMW